MNDEFKQNFNKLIDSNIAVNQLVKNIIIEDEIITNEKYIANIKVNFDKEKIINFLINNKINFTDLKSDPFLVIIYYNVNFINIGLEKINIFYNSFIKNAEKENKLINFYYPNLDPNDRYILTYKNIVNENKKSFNNVLSKI